MNRRPIAVAIPVKNEAAFIVPCLEALNAQSTLFADHVVLLVNNTTDGSAQLARSVPQHAGTCLHILERSLPSSQANAGHARRLAMDAGAALVGPDGVIITTDADGLVDPDWIIATINCLDAGADVVAGWVELHPADWGSIPQSLHEDDARECAYDNLCDAIHALLDPDPADPWPRHTQNSGASIALTVSAYHACGGVPPVCVGEDRALIGALRRVDARIRHSPAVHVTVSGRTSGRAAGGMADTIRRRLERPDAFIDSRLEPARHCARRAAARAMTRQCHAGQFDGIALARDLGLEPTDLSELLKPEAFGEVWDAVQKVAPTLQRFRVAVSDLPSETRAAQAILANLRMSYHSSRSEGPVFTAHVHSVSNGEPDDVDR